MYLNMSPYLNIYVYVYLSVSICDCVYVCLHICMYVLLCLSVCLCVCISVFSVLTYLTPKFYNILFICAKVVVCQPCFSNKRRSSPSLCLSFCLSVCLSLSRLSLTLLPHITSPCPFHFVRVANNLVQSFPPFIKWPGAPPNRTPPCHHHHLKFL